MHASRETTRPKRSVLLTILASIAALVLVVGALWAVLSVIASNRLAAQVQKVRDAGEPLTLKEVFARRPQIPDEQNGALVIAKVSEQLSELREEPGAKRSGVLILGGKSLPDWGEPYPANAVSASRHFLEAHAALLAELEPLRDRPSGRHEYDLTGNPYNLALPSLKPTRNAAKLLALSAVRGALDGDLDAALADTELAFNVAGTLDDEPIVISRLVAIACDALAIDALERVLAIGEGAEPSLQRVQRVVARRLEHGSLAPALLGERALHFGAFAGLANGTISLSSLLGCTQTGFVPNYAPSFFAKLNQAKLLELLAPAVTYARDHRRCIAELEKAETQADALGPVYFLAKMLMPSLPRAAVLNARCVAQMRAAQAALAAERYRLAHGAWPESLDVLVPEYLDAVPADPFAKNGPLLYVRTAEGVTFYSINENGVDDGGDVRQVGPNGARFLDIGFRLLDPERRGVVIAEDKAAEDKEAEADDPDTPDDERDAVPSGQ